MLKFRDPCSFEDNQKHQGDGHLILKERNVLIISDGVSSEKGSGKETVKAFQRHFEATNDIYVAVERLLAEDSHSATIVVAEMRDNLLRVLSLGDSRCYLQRTTELVQLTHDHSLYEAIRPHLREEIDPRIRSREEIFREVSREKYDRKLIEIITKILLKDAAENIFDPKKVPYILKKFGKLDQMGQCLREIETRGSSPTLLTILLKASVSMLLYHLREPKSKKVMRVKEYEVIPEDEVLLTTDGFHGIFTEEELKTLMNLKKSFLAKVPVLFQEAKSRGLKDDATFVLAKVSEMGS